MNRLLQVVAGFCGWSGMRVKREKSMISAVDYKSGKPLPTKRIVFEGAPLSHLAATGPFPYLGIRASLISKGCRGLVGSARSTTAVVLHFRGRCRGSAATVKSPRH